MRKLPPSTKLVVHDADVMFDNYGCYWSGLFLCVLSRGAVKVFKLSHCSEETLLLSIYAYYGSLVKVP